MLGLDIGGMERWLPGELLLVGVGGDGGGVLSGQRLGRACGGQHCLI